MTDTVPAEVRIALQDVMTDYCYAVDRLDHVDELLDLFTVDAVLEFSTIGLATMHGRTRWEPFYREVFAGMSHHTHYISNFRLERWTGDAASIRAYVQGLGRAKDGNEVHVHVRYRMDCVRRDGHWRIARYEIHPGMPLPGSLTTIHAGR